MTISQLSTIKSVSPELGQNAHQGLASEPVQADVDFFNAAMRPDNGPATSHLADQVASALSERLGDTAKLSQQALRQMKKVANSEDGSDIVQMGRALSQCSLQMALTTKVVSKSAQALDKLTNLQ
ncbi:type III secretion system inner rod subunit SctI [Pseudomonas syringae]|uniref:EscI/YscI/HrpB family type III secretion system inner rod protein n=3 Tax=Pseudomonas syringae group TaxID=136849 RepID=A0A9Q4FHY4_PSESX|nr:type III secretion system inner rod subunit SctI [Pseudomonas syringae]KTB59273.1 type III secretion protein [Pseudomonas viridiflava ICMP 13104]AHG42320.1 type III secretion protein [Pseudomonas syringae CC1557]KTB84822.1 type III secretion protein [Pseudomonas syringae pv. syringae PD2766]MCF5467672.1 EscI/YscI/HrpB family type III secretion system inner rod protein [Pseudomonas syringae]MCF5474598.1 EscI/YscI/HrpB family type III secretion system inner rod protein [Pseudomonas syringae]